MANSSVGVQVDYEVLGIHGDGVQEIEEIQEAVPRVQEIVGDSVTITIPDQKPESENYERDDTQRSPEGTTAMCIIISIEMPAP